MAQKTKQKRRPAKATEDGFDGVYLLKLVLYLIMGSLWLKIGDGGSFNMPLPVGFAIGLLFASHEHFQIDRKIEFAILVVAMFFGYFAPYGLYITLS